MTAVGLYFSGLSRSETNALRRRLNALAAEYGFLAERGPTAGQGLITALLRSIDDGEAVVILVPEAHKPLLAQWLREQAAALTASAEDFATLDLVEDLESIAEAIQPPSEDREYDQ